MSLTIILNPLICSLLFIIPSLILLLQSFSYFISLNGKSTFNERGIVKRPLVSILVAFKNEPLELIRRFINGISKVNWPRDKLEIIMVSDDPIDIATRINKIVKSMSEELKLQVVLLNRSEGKGGKAGALNYGLKYCRGKYVLVMDIDSVVNKEFINKAVRILESDYNVAAVVGRWKALNKNTRIAEGLAYSMEFIVDASFRAWSKIRIPVYTLGTGTLYRKETLEELGGWCEDLLMEDLEIGIRIISKGYRIIYLDECEVYVEVPPTLYAYRIQQYKWSYGAIELLRKRIRYLLKAPIPWYGKILLTHYPLQYLSVLTTFIGVILLSLTAAVLEVDVIGYSLVSLSIWLASLIINGIAFNHCLSTRGISKYRSLVLSGRNTGLLISQSPYISIALIKGIFGLKIKRRVTPKGKYARQILETYPPYELLIFIALLLFIVILMLRGLVYTSSFIALYASSYAYALYRWHDEILGGLWVKTFSST